MRLFESQDQRHKAAEWALEVARPDTIAAAVKRMQVMKGRTYTEVAARMYGQETGTDGLTHIERAICEMMQERRVTLADVAKWYKIVTETEYAGHKFMPLPDYTACIKVVEKAQLETFRIREVAHEVLGSSPVADRVKQIGAMTTTKTMPELFAELKKKFETKA